MNSPADRRTSTATLQAALLEYFEAPGKFQLSLRQPALLFASIREVLQLAAGRSAGVEQPENKAVMEAAAFFIRAALLYPGATHYTVMGLPARTEPIELKERYRLLMRLIHPDFAAAHSQTWPGDAAVRVNRAYEVLSSPVLRSEYDEQLATAGSQRPSITPKMDVNKPAPANPAESASWRFNRAAIWVLVGCGGAVVVGALIPWQGPDQLVQKVDTPVSLSEEAPARLQPANLQKIAAVSAPVEPPPLQLPPPLPLPAAVPVPAAVRTPAPAPAPVARPAPPPAPRAEPPMQLRASASAPAVRVQPAPLPSPSPAIAARTIPAPAAPLAQAPRLAAATQFSAPEPARQPERRVEVPAQVTLPAAAPAPAPAPAPIEVARQEPPRPVAIVVPRSEPVRGPTGTEPSLTDAQPLLTQLLQSMEGGSGENMLRLLESEARRNPAALALSREYDQLVGRARPVRLSHVEFRSEAREGVLLVTGRLRLHAGEPTIGAVGERMSLRAEFVSRGGRVLLTGLSSGSD